ncbi:MAG: non-histone chromosomal MC1 family protein [Myxococcota bacterium]|nr:non-histone chromosomal MC1 family protein [Myxococcota bacterium]
MAEKKNFVLLENGKDTGTVFSSRQPRGAALKAANRGHTDIQLRERGTNKVHVFTGERLRVPAPKNAPSWVGDMVWKANVKKLRTDKL